MTETPGSWKRYGQHFQIIGLEVKVFYGKPSTDKWLFEANQWLAQGLFVAYVTTYQSNWVFT